MSYASAILDLPQEFQQPVLDAFDALRHDMRDELAVRREDMQRVERALGDLAKAQARTEQCVKELVQAQARTEEMLQKLIARVDHNDNRIAQLVGDNLERRYRERAFSYFGQILRRVQVISLQDVFEDLEKHLEESEIGELLSLDLLIRGRPRHRDSTPEIYLAVEVSGVIDRSDVERAVRRAALLRKADVLAVPAVAGEKVTAGGFEFAQEQSVLLLQDGSRSFWPDAFSAIAE